MPDISILFTGLVLLCALAVCALAVLDYHRICRRVEQERRYRHYQASDDEAEENWSWPKRKAGPSGRMRVGGR